MTEAGLSVTDLLFPSLLAGLVPAATALRVRAVAASGLALFPDYAMHLLGRQPYSTSKKLALRAVHRPLYASLAATPMVRDGSLAVSDSCRTVVRRARVAARTGNYDDTAIESRPAGKPSSVSA